MEQATAAGPARRWWWPSFTHWVWLTLVLTLLALPWRIVMISADGDACFHWRTGAYMLETGRVIRADVFSHTRYGERIISKEWLAEIVMAAAGRIGEWSGAGGLYALSVLGALLIASAFALLHRQLRREGNDVLMGTFLVLLAAWAASNHWLARPHAFSFVMMVLWHGALRRFERGAPPAHLALALAVLTLFWVNLHGAFLAGFVVLGIYWCAALIAFIRGRHTAARHKLAVLTGVGLLCAVVSLANPSGLALHAHNLQFLRSEFFKNWLNEYRSINFQNPMSRGFLAWLAVMFWTFAWRRPRIPLAEGLLLVVWTYFALYSARNIALLAILSAPILAPPLSEGLRTGSSRLRETAERVGRIDRSSNGWIVVAAIAFVVIVLFPRPTEMPRDRWPVRALAWIREHPQECAGPMFNQYSWGGWLLQFLPEHKVFVDGRADFYGEELIREFDDTTALQPNWREPLEKYGVTWTLMPSDHRLNQALALLPDWELVFSNEVSTIYHRTE